MDVIGLALAAIAGVVIGLVVGYWLLSRRIGALAEGLLDQWKRQAEAEVAVDAEQRSEAVLTGKISEQVAPMHLDFPFNPSDARFLGSPLDFIVFDGYADVRDGKAEVLRELIFVDVKTGSARLTPVERRIKACVEAGQVHWRLIDLTKAEIGETTP